MRGRAWPAQPKQPSRRRTMLHIHLLGSVRLEHDAVLLPALATHKATSLLGYLVMHAGRTHRRETLAELFWPDRPATSARRSLHTALWQIRHALKQGGLDPDEFLTGNGTFVEWPLNDAIQIDVVDFEAAVILSSTAALQRAVDLYEGPFLEGLYDNWCIEERYRLEELYLQALGSLATAYRSEGNFAVALEQTRRLLKIDPLCEDAHRVAMETLYQLHQRAAALQQYETCARLLKRELNAEPSIETRRLRAAILDESLLVLNPDLNSIDLPAPVASRDRSSNTNHPLLFDATGVPFADRREELAWLTSWWTDRREPMALISGEAGAGKTRLGP